MKRNKKERGVKMSELVDRESIEFFDFKCPYCDSENIDIRSLLHSYRPDLVDSSDLRAIAPKEANRLGSLPTLKESILMTDEENLVVCCKDCNIASRVDKHIDRVSLRRWLKKMYGSMVMLL